MSVIGGVDWVAVQKAMQNWIVAGTALDPTKVIWGQQDGARPASPAIELRVSNVAEIGRTWVTEEANPLVLTTKTITAVDTTADTLAIATHGLFTGDGPVNVASTVALPTAVGGDLAGDTDYWVIAPDTGHIQLARKYSDTGGGQGAGNPTTPIDLTGVGSGVITLVSTPDTRRAGAESLEVTRGILRVSLELRGHSVDGVGMSMATSILNRIRSREPWSSQQAILANANIAVIEIERTRAIQGVRDAALFEPRAQLDVHFAVPVEEATTITYIAQAVMQFLTTGQTLTAGTP